MNISQWRRTGEIVMLIAGILTLSIILPLFACQEPVPTTFDITIDEFMQMVRPGDIICSRHVHRGASKRRALENLIRFGTLQSYSHVGIVVRLHGELHLFEGGPPGRKVSYSTNPRNTNNYKIYSSGFTRLREFFNQHQVVSYRPLIVTIDESTLLAKCLDLEKHMIKTRAVVDQWLQTVANPISTKLKLAPDSIMALNCMELVAYVLMDCGFDHSGFTVGMNIVPFTEEPSSLFGPMKSVGPAPWMSQ